MVKREDLSHFIDYFLCFNKRQYENFLIENYWSLLMRNKLEKTVFQILYRLSLNCDKKDRIKNFETFVYNNFIWDAFRLFDLCVILKHVSLEIARRICENLLKYKLFKESIFYFFRMIFKTFELVRRDLFKKKLQSSNIKKKFIFECIENVQSFLKVMPEFTNSCEAFLTELVTQFENVFPFLLNSKILEYKIQLNVSDLIYNLFKQIYLQKIKLEFLFSTSEFVCFFKQFSSHSNCKIGSFNFSFLLHTTTSRQTFSIVKSNMLPNVIFSYYPKQKIFNNDL